MNIVMIYIVSYLFHDAGIFKYTSHDFLKLSSSRERSN